MDHKTAQEKTVEILERDGGIESARKGLLDLINSTLDVVEAEVNKSPEGSAEANEATCYYFALMRVAKGIIGEYELQEAAARFRNRNYKNERVEAGS